MIVYLAIDYFFENWNSEGDRKLWMGVLPYVKDGDALQEWIEKGSEDGVSIEYQLMSGVGNTTYENYIPIPLSLDTDLSVTMSDSNGDEVLSERLLRTDQFYVTDPDLFRRLNVATGITPIIDDWEDDSLRLQPVEKDQPYAVALVKALRSMWSHQPADIPLWLQLAFEIGQRRKFSASCMSKYGPYISVPHPDDSESGAYEVTNLHCLAGLMLPLGSDFALLNRVARVQISFEVSGGVVGSVDLHKGRKQKIALRRFFETIRPTFAEPDRELKWLSEMARRAYAIPMGQMFKHEYLRGISNVVLFRRPRDGGEKARPIVDISYEHLDRLVVRYNVEGAAEHPTEPESLGFKAISTFDLQGDPYRSFPVTLTDGADSRNVVIEITAQPHDMQRWQFMTSELYAARGETPQLQDKLRLYKVSDEGDFEVVQFHWVALFNFPWEGRSAPIVLMCAPNDASGRYVALLDVDRRRSLTLELKGLEIEEDPLGPRWEYRHTSQSAFQFDTLELTSDLGGLDANDLVVSAYSDNEYQFELAQSARRIEGVAKVGIEEVPHFDDPDKVDAGSEYAGDYINHNTANFVEEWNELRHFLNSSSESTPDYWEQGLGKNWYTFHFRFTSPTSARSGLADVRGFYRDTYAKLGTRRRIHIDLEHTYGTRLSFSDGDGYDQQTFLDEPILHPADVSEQLAEDERIDFVWVNYVQAEAGELVQLKFDRRLLNREWISSQSESVQAKLIESHIEAWQSVAELVRAKRIILVCEAYRFDFHAALASEEPSVGNGLVLSQPPITFNVTQAVKGELSGWLNGGSDIPLNIWQIEIPHTGEVLWKSSHVIRFYLTVGRPEELHPPVREDWSIVARPTEVPDGDPQNLVDANGSVVIPIDDATTKEMLDRWMTRLVETSSYLDAQIDETTDRDRLERYRGLLGSGPQLGPAPRESKAWVIPEGIADPSGLANMVVLPLGFRPFQKDQYLGETTVTQIRAYFDLLQHAIDMRSEDWARTLEEDEWLSLFKSWDAKSANGREVGAAYADLCRRATSTLFPVPDTGEASKIHPVVLNTALAVKGETQIAEVIYAEALSRISTNPASFAKNKAFVYTRLTGQGLSPVAPTDFYSLKVEKVIASNAGLEGVPEITDEYSAVYSLGLKGVANTNWFGFLEGLDDNLYDNEFKITNVSLSSVENLLEESAPSEMLEDNVIYIPDDRPQKLPDAGSGKEIVLPSRQLVKKPVTIATGMFDIAQSLVEFERAFPLNESRDFGAFLEGDSQPPQDGILSVSRIASFGTRRTMEIDDVMISCILSVRGDEEFESDWLNGLANDAFFIRIDNDPDPSLKVQTNETPSPSVLSTFDLLGTEDAGMRDLSDVLSPKTLQYVSRVVSDIELEVGEPANFMTKFIIKDNGSGSPEVSFEDNNATRAVEVHVFQGVGGDVEDVLYIWLNVELGVWRPRFIRLSQSRNFKTTNRQFAEEFGTLSNGESSGLFPRKAIVKSLRDRETVDIPIAGPISARRYLNYALISSDILTELGEEGGVQRFVVNITLNDIIEPMYPTMGPMINESKADEVGVFPIENVRITEPEDWDTKTFDWFPDADELRIHVEWRRRDTNDILFRVEGLRVRKISG